MIKSEAIQQVLTEEQQLLQRKRVIVRVWASKANIYEPGENVGHVSIEVDNRYMSLWPQKEAKDREGKGLKSPISHKFVENYDTEVKEYEGRPAEFTVCFYTLEPDDIKQKFESFREKLTGWCLFGGLCEDAHSCVSIAWDLLLAGGMRKLASSSTQSSVSSEQSWFGSLFSGKGISKSRVEDSSRGSTYSIENAISWLVKSPDAILPLLIVAKKQEWQKNPLTKTIAYHGETNPADYARYEKMGKNFESRMELKS